MPVVVTDTSNPRAQPNFLRVAVLSAVSRLRETSTLLLPTKGMLGSQLSPLLRYVRGNEVDCPSDIARKSRHSARDGRQLSCYPYPYSILPTNLEG